jgi:predicted transcriptional regulator
MRLPFPDLMQWCNKRQKHLGWTNQALADYSKVPIGTITRIKAGDYFDCKYSTIRSIVITLVGGTTDEWPCNAQVEKELQQVEELEKQAAKLASIEKENESLKNRLDHIDELHRNDIRAIKAEYQEHISFLKEQLKAWQSR